MWFTCSRRTEAVARLQLIIFFQRTKFGGSSSRVAAVMTLKQLDLALPDVQDFVPRHISATPMAAGFNAASIVTQQAVVQEVAEQLASYASTTGICLPFRTHLAMATQ